MSAPVLEDVGQDMPLERVPPVQRELPPLRPRRRPPLVAASLAVVGALLAGLVAAMAPDPPLAWTLASGELVTPDGAVATRSTAPTDTELVAGDEGAVLQATGARMELAPGSVVQLEAGVGPVAQTVVLREGALVADVEVTLSVDATVATVTGFGGAFRVDRATTPRVATYTAAVGITGDTAVSMTRLHQVPLGGNQAAVGPIILDPEDPWDARYGETPLEIDAQLAALHGGLVASYGSAPQTPAFYQDFVGVTEGLVEALPQLAPVDRGERFGPPAETLIAAAAVTALLEGTGRPLSDVLAEVVVERAAGGTWGVILAQDGLDAAFLRQVTDEALRRREAQPSPEPVLPDEPPAPAEDAEPEPEPGPEPEPQPEPEPEPEPEPSDPDEAPEPEPEPEPEPGPLEDPVGTIDDLLDPDDGPLVPDDRLLPPGPRDAALPDVGGTVDDLLGLVPLVNGVATVLRLLGAS